MERIPTASTKTPEHLPTPTEKVREYLARQHEILAKRIEEMQEGVPAGKRLTVAPDFRLIPPPDTYDPVDRKIADQVTRDRYDSDDEKQIQSKENTHAGTAFEMFKTAIMHKHMGKRFIIVRASRYDDYINGVDNVLMDTATGHIVCAFDEISNNKYQSAAVMNKTKKVLGRNFGMPWDSLDYSENLPDAVRRSQKTREYGASLKYGIEFEDGKIRCKTVNHLPIFMLSLNYEDLDEGQYEFINGEVQSPAEKRIFKYFLTMLSAQIQQLKLKPRHYESLPENLRERVDSFQRYIEEILQSKT